MHKARLSTAMVLALLSVMLLATMSGYAQSPVELTLIFGDPVDADDLQQVAAMFEAAHPGVKVHVNYVNWDAFEETLISMFAGGTPPDVVLAPERRKIGFAQSNLWMDLSSHVTTMPRGDSRFAAGYDSVRLNGTLYGIPADFQFSMLHYQADLFNEAGLESPWALYQRGEWTWPAFLEAARRIARDVDGNGSLDIAGMQQTRTWDGDWPAWIWTNGGRMLDEAGRVPQFGSPEIVETFEFLQDIHHGYQIATTASPWNGRTGMWVAGILGIPARERYSFEWDLAPLPIGPSGDTPGGTFFSGNYSIASDTRHPQEALALVRYFLSDEAEAVRMIGRGRIASHPQGVANWIELITSRPDQSPRNVDAILEMSQHARALPVTPVWTEMRDEIGVMLSDVLGNRQPPRTALGQLDERLRPLLQDW